MSDDKQTPAAAELKASLTLAEQAKDTAEKAKRQAEEKLSNQSGQLATALAEKSTAEAEVIQLKAEIRSKDGEIAGLKSNLKEEQGTSAKLREKLKTAEEAELREKILELAASAVEKGMDAKYFEGVDADPLAWFAGKGFASLKALEDVIGIAPTTDERTATTSGKPQKATAEDAVQLTDEEAADMKRRGLDPKYLNVKDERDLIALRETENAKAS